MIVKVKRERLLSLIRNPLNAYKSLSTEADIPVSGALYLVTHFDPQTQEDKKQSFLYFSIYQLNVSVASPLHRIG